MDGLFNRQTWRRNPNPSVLTSSSLRSDLNEDMGLLAIVRDDQTQLALAQRQLESGLHRQSQQQLHSLIYSLAMLASSSGVSSLTAALNQQFSLGRDSPQAMCREINTDSLVQRAISPQADLALSSRAPFPSTTSDFQVRYRYSRGSGPYPVPLPGLRPVMIIPHPPHHNLNGVAGSLSSSVGAPPRAPFPQGLPFAARDTVSFLPSHQSLGTSQGFDKDGKSIAGFLQCASFPFGPSTSEEREQPVPEKAAPLSQGSPPNRDNKRLRSLRSDSSPMEPPACGGDRRLDGDTRLVIDFDSFGERGAVPQSFGSEHWILPNGLRGNHSAYNQKWRFEISHNPPCSVPRDASSSASPLPHLVCVTWRITHIKSNVVTERTETEHEAEKRLSLGWTIATKVFVEAMAKCAEQLRAQAEMETGSLKKRNLVDAANALEVKGFTQGPLLFGLRHRSVQEALQAQEIVS